MIGLALADVPAILGLALRHYRGPQDHPAMVWVYQAAHDADGLEGVTLVNCDPERDIVLAEVDGELIAYARSMVATREAGFTFASPGVDAANPTGALGLYESLGFAAERSFTAYRRRL